MSAPAMFWVRDRAQVHEVDAVLEGVAETVSQFGDEACLARAGRPEQRDER